MPCDIRKQLVSRAHPSSKVLQRGVAGCKYARMPVRAYNNIPTSQMQTRGGSVNAVMVVRLQLGDNPSTCCLFVTIHANFSIDRTIQKGRRQFDLITSNLFLLAPGGFGLPDTPPASLTCQVGYSCYRQNTLDCLYGWTDQ
jgi:hypothetical protein